ncbi:MAG: hypothetical protein HY437_01585 [Candidatus Magasanikbacteria bacterium]|nr:hypothetical protein [Candidatus Magasanikbacteria bacterium]
MQSVIETVTSSFETLFAGFIAVFPALLAAFLVLVIGWAISALVGGVVARLINLLWIEKLIERLRIKDAFGHMGLKLNFGGLIGWLVKWFLIVVFFIAASDILGLTQITEFLNEVVVYIPNVVIAVVVLLLGVIIGAFAGEVVEKAVKASGVHSGELVGGVAKWAIVVFAFMAALVQLGIAADMIKTLFTGFVGMLALAGGLAFGLGGREHAESVLASLKHDLTKRK